jgi:hypothetical protein
MRNYKFALKGSCVLTALIFNEIYKNSLKKRTRTKYLIGQFACGSRRPWRISLELSGEGLP